MLFTTLPYALFFAIAFVVHWVLPQRLRRPWLLLASYCFYMQAIPQYVLLIAAMTLTNYGFGLALGGKHQNPASSRVSVPRRKALLLFAIAANLATLAFFKYAAFGLNALWAVVRLAPHAPPAPVVQILLPLGISFFTFEFIHYVVEVYRGQPPMRNLIDFALFAAFFPTQIAGPIKRFPDWVKQLGHPAKLAEVQADEALSLIVRGMAKKIIIADTLAPLVGVAFGQPQRLGFLAAWLTIYAFAAQIYADFSGYTDIGRGCALLLGYRVPENFANPYGARDPGEFWERWHISLSRWLRDYLFIPLGGSRCAFPRICLNLLITMALGGLWHGASWHFMLWGAYQGLLLIGQRVVAPPPAPPHLRMERGERGERWQRLGGQIVTFHLMCFGWVLFRAETPAAIGQMLLAAGTPWRNFTGGFDLIPTSALGLPALVLGFAALVVVGGWAREWAWAGKSQGSERADAAANVVALLRRVQFFTNHAVPYVRPLAFVALLALVCIWPQGAAQRFIYFQF